LPRFTERKDGVYEIFNGMEVLMCGSEGIIWGNVHGPQMMDHHPRSRCLNLALYHTLAKGLDHRL